MSDTDSDGIGNNADTDDDNDGVLDEEDGDPLAANAPIIAPIEDALVLEGDTFITAITVTDADNSELDVVVEGADADAVMLSESGRSVLSVRQTMRLLQTQTKTTFMSWS